MLNLVKLLTLPQFPQSETRIPKAFGQEEFQLHFCTF